VAYRDYPLSYRMRWAENRRQRYRSDPDYRLARLNEQRRLRGRPLLDSLEQLARRGGHNRKQGEA